MNLEEIFCVNIKRPEIQLVVEFCYGFWRILGQERKLSKMLFHTLENQQTMGVRPANEIVNKARQSEDLNIIDSVSGLKPKIQVILSPQCPVNLLGRDLISQLRTGLLPGKKGQIKIQHMTTEVNMLEGLDEPVPSYL